ncbi:hypothetical protein BCR33DRAFT_721393 [Rhizoclosmatium globosum]|uniref:Uncharacterized protein n=1 Tax=Rhizoclosmatium globosum TaxID=329046 RepID=A0A1Y2BSF8_9FUNG|nr:hypothetical protein BCR33DRAFT_721393 [Rhizoclosmatium globosum]|eukprot:ORY37673.1 hypothetical protein BCR33DRAFT_721393 [Rhizoclosmatium globosum]
MSSFILSCLIFLVARVSADASVLGTYDDNMCKYPKYLYIPDRTTASSYATQFATCNSNQLFFTIPCTSSYCTTTLFDNQPNNWDGYLVLNKYQYLACSTPLDGYYIPYKFGT